MSLITRINALAQAVAADIKALQQTSPSCIVNFDGTQAAPVIRWGYNVASITKVSTGRYRITFATAMSSTGYVVTGSPTRANATDANGILRPRGGGLTAQYVEVVTGPGGTTSLEDYDTISLVIHGGK